MTKDLTTYQALMVEFDLVCSESGLQMPEREEIQTLSAALNLSMSTAFKLMGAPEAESTVQAAVCAWMTAKGRVG